MASLVTQSPLGDGVGPNSACTCDLIRSIRAVASPRRASSRPDPDCLMRSHRARNRPRSASKPDCRRSPTAAMWACTLLQSESASPRSVVSARPTRSMTACAIPVTVSTRPAIAVSMASQIWRPRSRTDLTSDSARPVTSPSTPPSPSPSSRWTTGSPPPEAATVTSPPGGGAASADVSSSWPGLATASRSTTGGESVTGPGVRRARTRRPGGSPLDCPPSTGAAAGRRVSAGASPPASVSSTASRPTASPLALARRAPDPPWIGRMRNCRRTRSRSAGAERAGGDRSTVTSPRPCGSKEVSRTSPSRARAPTCATAPSPRRRGQR